VQIAVCVREREKGKERNEGGKWREKGGRKERMGTRGARVTYRGDPEPRTVYYFSALSGPYHPSTVRATSPTAQSPLSRARVLLEIETSALVRRRPLRSFRANARNSLLQRVSARSDHSGPSSAGDACGTMRSRTTCTCAFEI